MPHPRSIEVVINSSAGVANSDLADELAELFRKAGADALISIASSGTNIIELARKAVERSDVIVAGGGDGTINGVASVVLEKNKVLGILPLGTLNHFAKDLNIPLDLPESVRTVVDGRMARVDVGSVNGRKFLNNSSLGLYPSIVTERRKRQRLGHGKWPAFMWAAISVLRRYPFLGIRLETNNEKITSRTPFIFFGNNEYEMEGFQIGARKSLQRGCLCVYMTLRTGRLGLFRLALRALLGRSRKEKDFISLVTNEAWVESKRKRLHVALDGEVVAMKTPLHYQILPSALQVIVPARKND